MLTHSCFGSYSILILLLIRAKTGAQRTVVGGAGLVLAAFVMKWLGKGDVKTAVGLYCALTLAHLISNYRALKLVALDWLNGWRLHLVVEEFLDSIKDRKNNGRLDGGSVAVSNPLEASRREPLLFLPEFRSMNKQSSKYPIRMGVSFNDLMQLSYRPQSLMQSLAKKQSQRRDNYILTVGHSEKRIKAKKCILVSYFSNSSNSEKAKAYLHGCLVRRALAQKDDNQQDGVADLVQKAEETAERELAQLWPAFEQSLAEAGWKLDKTECSTEGYELYLE